ncbi:MAG: hypothetical protein WD887_01300 [Candidatus Saccharimonadales bacterium]
MKPIKIYVAGKVSNNSVFGTHDWRDKFLDSIAALSGLKFINYDPVKKKDITGKHDPHRVFSGDLFLISKVDVVVVYFSDDVSVGASQEVLVAKYFNKPVIGLAPKGGKFNGGTKKVGEHTIKDYHHPFVFGTCDMVVGDIEELAEALKNLHKIKPKTIHLIKEAADKFEKKHLKADEYVSKLLRL